VASVVGLAEALRLAQTDAEARDTEHVRQRALSATLFTALGTLGGGERSGHPRERVGGIASWVFDNLNGDDLVAAADLGGLAVSTGSACTSGSAEPSHVLLALGLTPDRARGSLRISLGRTTTEAEVAEAAAILERCVARLREALPTAVTLEDRLPAPAGA
jgi:cysteine desulfurase